MKLIIKPEFDKKLKNLRIKTRFLNNLKKERANLEMALQHLNTCETFNEFISDAFFWDNTPEGTIYWYKISRK